MGDFVLSNDINWAYVEIEGPAYFVTDVVVDQARVGVDLIGRSA